MSPNPPDGEVLGQAAKALLERNRPELARAVAEEALRTNPDIGNIHSVMAGILDELGESDAALVHWRRAAALMPHSPQQQLNLALAHLVRGDHAAGLPRYEARRDKADWITAATNASMAANLATRLQPGMAVAGRHVVVLSEQGLGDCILFARYLPLLAAAGAKVTMVCKPALQPVFAGISGITSLLIPPPDQPHGKINLGALPHDLWIPLLSLPWFFGTTPATVPADIPYFTADPDRVAAWRRRYGRPGLPKIGVVLQANPESRSAAERSMAPADLVPILKRTDIAVVNLQGGTAGRSFTATHPGVIDALSQDIPLDEFAAAIAATDLLVSVDTMAAHLAGAMGHPCAVAVPLWPHWYWSQPGRSPWYPGANLFRQTERGNWATPVAAIAAALDHRP